MEKFIITFEDGEHYITDDWSNEDYEMMLDGLLTIIILPDGKILDANCEFVDLPKWGDNNA